MILSLYGDRYNIEKSPEALKMLKLADYAIADSKENYKKVQKVTGNSGRQITNITPFDTRVDFGISQQLNVQKVLVPVDGLDDARFAELIRHLGEYLPKNENARIHLFTRLADFDKKKQLLEKTRECLRMAGLEERWALEDANEGQKAENRLDLEEQIPVKFFVEQCVDELSVSKCIREQRLVVDLRKVTEVYLRVLGISVGIPQIVYRTTEFVEDRKNGRIIKDMNRLPEVLEYYLENLTNWNEAMVYAYELGEKYTTSILIEKWKEVIDFVSNDSGSSNRN